MGFAVEKIPVRRSDVLYFFRRRHVGIKQVLLYHRRPLLVRLILVFFYNVVDYTVPSYIPSHLTAVLGYGPTKGLLIILIVMSIMIPIIVAMGRIGDRISGKRLVHTTNRMIPAYYLIFSCLVGLVVASFFVKNTSGKPLRGSLPSVASEDEIDQALKENEGSMWWREERKAIEAQIQESAQVKSRDTNEDSDRPASF